MKILIMCLAMKDITITARRRVFSFSAVRMGSGVTWLHAQVGKSRFKFPTSADIIFVLLKPLTLYNKFLSGVPHG